MESNFSLQQGSESHLCSWVMEKVTVQAQRPTLTWLPLHLPQARIPILYQWMNDQHRKANTTQISFQCENVHEQGQKVWRFFPIVPCFVSAILVKWEERHWIDCPKFREREERDAKPRVSERVLWHLGQIQRGGAEMALWSHPPLLCLWKSKESCRTHQRSVIPPNSSTLGL